MAAFHEARLPARLAFGSTGGVERRTEIVTLASGFERRSTPWAMGRRRYLIGANLRSLDDMVELVAFFEARRGRLHGFRFKDFADFKSCAPGGAVSAGDQALGVGDGVRRSFQLIKRYGDVEVSGFAVDGATGAVTLAVAPGAGVEVTAGFLFDTPVRFDTDRIETTLESFEAGRMVGRTYGRMCDARFGDGRCGIAVEAGTVCDKRWTTCVGTFGNGVNFRGFPDVPGDDFLTAFPAGSARNDGGSRR